MARRIRSITNHFKNGATFGFTLAMEEIVRALLAETRSTANPRLSLLRRRYWQVSPYTCTVMPRSHARTRPMVYISRTTLDNEQNKMTPMELEFGRGVYIIRRLRYCLFSAFFTVYTNCE